VIEKKIYKEMDIHLIEDEKPSEYFNSLDKSIFKIEPFTMLERLKFTEQSPIYHPEGNVWNHTMLVVDHAAKMKSKSSDERVFMWGALLHDLGKPDTTRNLNGRITSYDHDKIGAKLAKKFLKQLDDDQLFTEKVTSLVRWHMQILYVVKGLPFANIERMKRETSINDVALLGLCDRLGRTNSQLEKEEENIKIFINKCKKVILNI